MNLKLTRPQAQAVFVVVVCLKLACVAGLAMAFVRYGFRRPLVDEWLKAWAISFVVMVPVAWVGMPLVRRVVERVTR